MSYTDGAGAAGFLGDGEDGGFGGLAGGLVTAWLHPLLSEPLLIECLSHVCSQHVAPIATVAVDDLQNNKTYIHLKTITKVWKTSYEKEQRENTK